MFLVCVFWRLIFDIYVRNTFSRYVQCCELLPIEIETPHIKSESLQKPFFSPKMGTNESKSKSNPNFMINLALTSFF